MLDTFKYARNVAVQLAASEHKLRLSILQEFQKQILEKKREILDANEKDCNESKKKQINLQLQKRLRLTEDKLYDCAKGITDIINMKDVLNVCTLASEMTDGLKLFRITCPIGVIGIIFESRPEVAIDIIVLGIKSGNAVFLKYGKEAFHSVHSIYNTFISSLEALNLSHLKNAVNILDTRQDVDVMIQQTKYIDLIIPRGSAELVRYIKNNSKIPVMGHADGLCSVYVHEDADINKAIKVIKDSKTDYPSACNACETLIVHKSICEKLLPQLAIALEGFHVQYFADEFCLQFLPTAQKATEDHYKTEFLDYKLCVISISAIEDAIQHINTYGSHHTDVIITESVKAAEQFMMFTDSAGVYWNASTRFADGFRYGFGAEVGISTHRIHARGPVGLEGLLIYKYKMIGNGHTVTDIKEKIYSFKHKALPDAVNQQFNLSHHI